MEQKIQDPPPIHCGDVYEVDFDGAEGVCNQYISPAIDLFSNE